MKASCTLTWRDGGWSVVHSSPTFGTVHVRAGSRGEALTKLRDELQYRIELCPCSGASGDTVVLDVRDARDRDDLGED